MLGQLGPERQRRVLGAGVVMGDHPGHLSAFPGPGGDPGIPGLPTPQSPSEAAAIAAEIDQMIDLNQVEGRVRASSIRKISDLVDQHPEQAVNLIRQWVYSEQ